MDLRLIKVPYDSGFKGSRMGAGPDRLLAAGLAADLQRLGHAVAVTSVELPASSFLPEVGAAFYTTRAISTAVTEAAQRSELTIVLAGNCITSVGVLSGLGPNRTGVVWFDSHADLNTPDSSGSGFLDGMAVAILTGRCWPKLAAQVPGFSAVPDAHLAFVGVRDLDPPEQDLIAEYGIACVAASGFAGGASALENGAAAFEDGGAGFEGGLTDVLGRLRKEVEDVYVHLDLDVIDPGEIRANQYAAPDGPTVDQVVDSLREIALRFRVRAIGVTAYDPAFDVEGRMEGVVVRLLNATLGAE